MSLDQEDAPEEAKVLLTVGGGEGGASVEISLSLDEMLAWGRFLPPQKDHARLLVFSDLIEALQGAGITNGFQDLNIQEAIFLCNMEKKAVEKVVLARGTLPKGERPAFLKLEPHIYEHHFSPEKSTSVDFKEYSPFVIVKKGELLARAVKPQEGSKGFTVTGKEIAPGKKDIKILKPGPNTLFAHGKVFARCAGRFFVEGDNFDVSDTLQIQGGVDYSTGHVVFPGNIELSGVVQDGFKLVAGGNLTVKDTLDASEVLCKKDLVCGSGIIGKKPGILRVGGSVKALFMENCQMEALGTVTIAKAILNVRLFTNGSLLLEEGGRIVSSTVMVKESLHCSQLGNDNGPCTVTVGTDFVVSRKLDSLKAQHHEEEQALFKLKSRREDKVSSDSLKLEEEIRSKLEALVSEMNSVTPDLFNKAPFSLSVSGDVYPGCVIEMGYARLPIVSKQRGMVFKLSEDQKSIIMEKAEARGRP